MNRKIRLSLADQTALLVDRGLVIADRGECERLLGRITYYHLSGYARFFQSDPGRGDNSFRPGTSFELIRDLQHLDEELRHLCLRYLTRVESALRSGFALHFGDLLGPYEALLHPATYHSAGANAVPVHELVLRDLDRAKARFVLRHRDSSPPYEDLPVWVAMEALSFGTLSKCIEYCVDAGVAKAIAADLGIAHGGFSSQIRSFVSLRNECAHMSRLWNDVSRNPPQVPGGLVGRAKRRVGQFSPQSYFHVFVALDRFGVGRVSGEPGFLESVERLMARNETFAAGLTKPSPY